MGRPSSRRAARKLTQSGRRVSHETINRWRRQGWRPLDGEPRHPLDIARDRLDDALPVLTNDPMTTSTSFVRESAEGEALEHLSDTELQRRAARQVTVAVCVVAKAMIVKATVAAAKPAEFGLLARALAQCLQAGTAVLSEQPTANPGK
jgi:hypothetical protein